MPVDGTFGYAGAFGYARRGKRDHASDGQFFHRRIENPFAGEFGLLSPKGAGHRGFRGF